MNLKESLYSEILSIADNLCDDDVIINGDLSWKTLLKNNVFTVSNNCDIYSGVSGIVIFLLELYEETKIHKYLKSALDALSWVAKNYSLDVNLTKSFYTGSLGIVFAFYKAYKISNEPNLVKEAEQIFNYYLTQEDAINPSVDVINGIGGEIIGLLHIYNFTKNKDILKLIDERVDKLIENPIMLNSGLAWENSIFYQQPLCGFSHGAAGMGWVFLELGNYFQNDSFFWLAKETFAYEDSCFNPQLNNWPDYRAPVKESEYDEHYFNIKSGNLNYFVKPSFSNAWCHGAAGIGLSRLRAFEVLKDDQYKASAINAINCTVDSDVNDTDCSFELCHGNTGNADLFIESMRLNNKFIGYAHTIALKCITHKKDKEFSYRIRGEVYGKDISLFRGDSGVAYFFLRLLNNSKTPSILLPKVERSHDLSDISKYQTLSTTLPKIRIKIFEKKLPKTIFFILNEDSSILNEYLLLNKANNVDSFYLFMKEKYSDKNEKIIDLLEYEYALNCFYNKNINHALWNIKASLREKLIEESNFSTDMLNSITLNFPEDILLMETKWNWDEANTINEILKEHTHYVFIPQSIGLRKIKINKFNYSLLEKIKQNPFIYFAELVKKMLLEIDEVDDDKIKFFISSQIKEFLKIGVISFESVNLSMA